MIRWILIIAYLISILNSAEASVKEKRKETNDQAISMVSVSAGVLSKADIALVSSSINSNHANGEIAELITGEVYEKALGTNSGWEQVTPKMGRQGIDGIFVKYDENGRPKGLIVTETKYGSSTLGNTRDGKQMSDQWTAKRLRALSKRYHEVASKKIKYGPLPSEETVRHKINIKLKNGEVGVFWRRNTSDEWHYDGPNGSIEEAKLKAADTGDYLEAAGNGKISYRKRIFRIKINENKISITITDPNNGGKTRRITIEATEEIISKYGIKYKKELMRQIKNKFPNMTDEEIKEYVKQITAKMKKLGDYFNIQKVDINKYIRNNSLKAGIAGAVFGGLLQATSELIETGKINISEVAFKASMAGVSLGAGQFVGQSAITHINRSQTLSSAALKISKKIGLGSSQSYIKIIGGTVGGLTTSALLAVGDVCRGNSSLEDAAKILGVDALASIGAAGATSGAMSIVSTFGVASTGTAISTLSGAAATKATLAWIGNMLGGYGAIGGSIFLGVGSVAILFSVPVAVHYISVLCDERCVYERDLLIAKYLYENDEALASACFLK